MALHISDVLKHFADFLISCSEHEDQAMLFKNDPLQALQQAGFQQVEIDKIQPLMGDTTALRALRESLANDNPTDDIQIVPAGVSMLSRGAYAKRSGKKKVAKKKKTSSKPRRH